MIYVKKLKVKTKYKLTECREFYELLRRLDFIKVQYKDINAPVFEIKEYVKELKSMDDIIYMTENEISIVHFLRITKIKKLKDGIKH